MTTPKATSAIATITSSCSAPRASGRERLTCSASTSCAEALTTLLVIPELVVRRTGRGEQHDVAVAGNRGGDPEGALQSAAVDQLDAAAGERPAQLGRRLADQVDGAGRMRERFGERAEIGALE